MPKFFRFLISLIILNILILFIFPGISFADWPMFRNDHSHTGSSQYQITKQPTIIWSSGNIGASQANLTVDSEGTIYTGTTSFQLIAMDKDGHHKWHYNMTFPADGLVFDDNGNLYFSISGSNPFIYSLTKNGEKIWEYNLRLPGSTSGQYQPSGPIAISKDRQTLYTGVSFPSKTLLALNLDGTVKWQTGLSGQNPNGSVTIADSGNLYIGTGGNGRLISLNSSGLQRWSKTVGSGYTVNVQTPVLDENENVYVTTSGVTGGELLVSYSSAGVKRWQYQIANSVFAGLLAYQNGVIYIVEKNALTAINASDGSIKWRWNLSLPSNRSLTSPAVDKSGNILVTGSNTLYILTSEGQIRWSLPAADDLGPVVISDDNIIYTHQSSGSTGSIYKLGDHAPTLTPTPTPTATPTPTPTPSKTPLILIPGIGGSELKVEEDTIWNKDDGHGGTYNRAYVKDEIVWMNEPEARAAGDDDYFDVLRMKDDGITSEVNIGLTDALLARAYQNTTDFFTSNGYELNEDFFVFSYDWRLDNTQHINELNNRIQEIKTQTRSEKVDIIAHSMGGLIARAYISDPARAQNVRKLFTLGTPHLGAVDSIKKLRYGTCLTPLPVSLGPACLGIIDTETRDVIQNMTSVFQLAPSQAYFNFYSDEDNLHPYPYRTESGSLNYLQIKNLLTAFSHNIALFNPSESFHSVDSTLPNTNGVDVTIIAGSGIKTLGQIVELNITTLNGNQFTYKDSVYINGDETVPLLSAAISDPHKNITLNGSAKVYYTNQKHGNLVTSGPALNVVKNILEGSSILPDGASETPYKLGGSVFSVHSPVNIHVYDPSGNHTGPTTDGFEANIPGSSYDTLGDAKFVYLPDNGVYTVKFEAMDNGTFDFKIREFENDQNTKTILYKEIPLTDNTKAETVFDTSSSETPIIKVDENGDGTVDLDVDRFSILEGDANYDYTPPSISFDVNPKTIWPPNNKLVDINIVGTITDDHPYLVKILVEDEYDLVEPEVIIENQTNINQGIKLEASRKGDDNDGRKYIIKILVTDLAGNTSLSTFEVIVSHDQRNKK